MWIVQLALRRPYTFVVMALAILLAGGLAIARMPADIFPEIDIPIVSVVWQYGGLTPDDMADMITTRSERGMTTTVNDIEHMESQSYAGVSVIRMYFHPGAKIEAAIAQISAQANQLVGYLPQGARAPAIIRYNAASVPILQLGLSSTTLSEQEVFDLGSNFIRTQLATIQGASVPPPYGGKQRMVMVDIDPQALFSRRAFGHRYFRRAEQPERHSSDRQRQDRVARIPRGDEQHAQRWWTQFNALPVKSSNGTTTYMRDIAQVRDGYACRPTSCGTTGNAARC